MKCPACWAEKGYRRKEEGMWRLLRRLGFIPLRCRHCYHRFWTHRLLAIGKVIEPPARPPEVAPPETASVAARFVLERAEEQSDSAAPRRRAA